MFSTAEESGQGFALEQAQLHEAQDGLDSHGRARDELLEGHQQVNTQSHEDLRCDGIHAVTEDTADLQVLLDELEEQLDLPAGLVDIGDGLRGPAPVVGQEDKDLARFRIPILDPTDLRQRGLQCLAAGESDDLIL